MFGDIVKYEKISESGSVEKTVIGSYEPKLKNHTVNNFRNEKLFIAGGVGFDNPQQPASDVVIEFDLKNRTTK